MKLVEEQTESVGVQLYELEKFVTRARAQNDRMHTDSTKSIVDLFDGGHTTINEFSALSKSFQSELDSFQEVVEMATSGHEMFDEFGTDAQQQLSELRTTIEEAPLKECAPTGQTPRKRKFMFPTTLPSTGAAEDVVAKARGTFYSKRAALGEKEVNSPKKLAPVLPVADDAKPGGAGSAFLPAVAGKKKVLREAVLNENNDVLAIKAAHLEDGAAAAERRQSPRKRPADEVGGADTVSKTARRRFR